MPEFQSDLHFVVAPVFLPLANMFMKPMKL